MHLLTSPHIVSLSAFGTIYAYLHRVKWLLYVIISEAWEIDFLLFSASIYLDFTLTLLMPSAFGLKSVIIERSMADDKGVRVINL